MKNNKSKNIVEDFNTSSPPRVVEVYKNRQRQKIIVMQFVPVYLQETKCFHVRMEQTQFMCQATKEALVNVKKSTSYTQHNY